MSSSEQAGVTKLFSEIARYNELAEADRRLIRSMGEQISQLSEKIGRQRKNMGGVNAARENQRTVEKHVRLLENRVDQALLKFNKSLAQNRNLRQEIDDLRGERVVFQEVHKKLERVSSPLFELLKVQVRGNPRRFINNNLIFLPGIARPKKKNGQRYRAVQCSL